MSVVLLTHLSLYEYQPYLRLAPRNRQVNQAKQVQYRYSLQGLELVWLVWSHSSKAANPAVSLVSTFHQAQQPGYIKTALRVNLAAMHKCSSSPPMHASVSIPHHGFIHFHSPPPFRPRLALRPPHPHSPHLSRSSPALCQHHPLPAPQSDLSYTPPPTPPRPRTVTPTPRSHRPRHPSPSAPP